MSDLQKLAEDAIPSWCPHRVLLIKAVLSALERVQKEGDKRFTKAWNEGVIWERERVQQETRKEGSY